MRRRSIPDGTEWQTRIWGNIPGLNTFALPMVETVGEYGIPQLQPCPLVPDKLFPWEERSKYPVNGGAIHFYCEDVYLSSPWNKAPRLDHVPEVVKRAGVCLTPDYSIFVDYPKAVNIWNVYRARLLGALWQHQGIQVIPSLMWGEILTQGDFLFEGLPAGGTFAISTGHSQGDEALFQEFYTEALKRCQPDNMLVYGQGLKPWLEEQGCPVKRYAHRRDKISAKRKAAKG